MLPLTTARLELRALTEDDAPLMLAIYTDPDFIRFVGDRGVRTLADARVSIGSGALASYTRHGFGPYHVSLRADNTPIGICGLYQRDHLPEPDLGFAFLPAFRGQGLGYEAARAVIGHAHTALGLPRLAAIVDPANAASIGLLRKLGFVFERTWLWPGDQSTVHVYGRHA